MSEDKIINEGGQLRTCTGKGVDAFRLKALYLALKFRRDVGFEMDRRFNSVTYARKELGCKTRDIEILMALVKEKMNRVIDECEVITT